MIQIHPVIEFSATCPLDGMPLRADRVIVPGMRSLADASCPSCGAHYYVDLPVGQAIRSPATLDIKSGEIHDPRNVTWFSSLLKDAFANRTTSGIVPTVHRFFTSDRIIILNCLDFLYGHSLLKLLNVQRYLDHVPHVGCCVLVPSQLVHLVPEGVAEIWEFPVPLKEGWKWYDSLQQWIDLQMVSRRECFLSRAYSHPSSQIYDLGKIVRNLPDISNAIDRHDPVILFNCREDRLWGRDLAHQHGNIQRLYNRLGAIFPDMLFVLVGFGKKSTFIEQGPKMVDLRCDRFDRERDRLWMAYMQRTDCAIGVHGSNMLLPSGLAKSTIELVPRSRIGNSVQDFLFPRTGRDSRDALLFYRMLYGNDSLSDIFPSEVADMTCWILSGARFNSAWFKVGEVDDAISKANASSDTSVYAQAIRHLRSSRDSSFMKRMGKRIGERLLALVD